MNIPSILFIPARFRDYRMWHDIPARLGGRAEAIHFDRHEQIPWTADNAVFVDAARRLASETTSFDIVASGGEAARFAHALAEAGLAKGVVFFQPVLDSIPDDVRVDLTGLDGALAAYRPLTDVLREPDPIRQRNVLLQIVRDTAGPGRDAAGLALEIAMTGDHAQEFFTHLQEAAAAAAEAETGCLRRDPPWLERPWIDRLTGLTVPVTAIGPGPFPEAIARRARDVEVVVAAGTGGMAPPADRAIAAEALLHMLDRIG
jgi:hypothetical protein